MLRSACDVQQDYALSCGLRGEIIWDSLGPDQAEILKQKIQTLFPCNESDKDAIKRLNELFKTIWKQRIYTNGTLLSAIIYVLVTEEKNHLKAKFSTKYSCHPVFRTRKCLRDDNDDNSIGCCMLFIDEHARVYKSWGQYLNSNLLPAGTMIAPSNGVYNFNEFDTVNLTICSTPSSTTSAKIVRATDKIATVGGMLATVPIAATLALPVAAPIMFAASAVAISTTAYSTLRSAMTLRDRRKHKKSIALTDSGARGSWLGVASGIAGIGSTGATKVLTSMTSRGRKVSLAAKLAVNGMNVSSIVISGTGIANSLHDLYMKKSLTAVNALHLASDLLIFTHSLNNYRIASKILKQSHDSSSALRTVKMETRKSLDKILREHVKLKGKKSDLIRAVNEIPLNPINVLMNIYQTNGNTAALNGISLISNTVTASGFLQTFIITINGNQFELNLNKLAKEFSNIFVQHIMNPNSLIDVLNVIANFLNESGCYLLMKLANTFLNWLVAKFDSTLRLFVSTEKVLYKIIMHCIKKYHNLTYEYLKSKTCEIMDEIREYFISLNPVNRMNVKHWCRTCNGHYYVSTL